MAIQVDWKLKRGKWRPRLQGFAKDVHPAAIAEASTQAFKALEDPSDGACPPDTARLRSAVAALCMIKVYQCAALPRPIQRIFVYRYQHGVALLAGVGASDSIGGALGILQLHPIHI